MKSKLAMILLVGGTVLTGCANHPNPYATENVASREALEGIGRMQVATTLEKPQLLQGKWLSQCFENVGGIAEKAFATLEYSFDFDTTALIETRHFYKDDHCSKSGSADFVRNGKFFVGKPVDPTHPEAGNGARNIDLILESGDAEIPSPDVNQTIFVAQNSFLHLGDARSKPFDDRPSEFRTTIPFFRL